MSNSNVYVKSFKVNEEHQAIANITTNEPVEDTVIINGVEYNKGGTLDEIHMYGWARNVTSSGQSSYIVWLTREGLPEVDEEVFYMYDSGGYIAKPNSTKGYYTLKVTSVDEENNTFVSGNYTFQRVEQYDFTIKMA